MARLLIVLAILGGGVVLVRTGFRMLTKADLADVTGYKGQEGWHWTAVVLVGVAGPWELATLRG